MLERRQLPRTKVQRCAKVVMDSCSGFVACNVRDISTRGACIEFSHPVQIPDKFVLSFDNFRSARMCRVRWRDVYRVGVQFWQPDVA